MGATLQRILARREGQREEGRTRRADSPTLARIQARRAGAAPPDDDTFLSSAINLPIDIVKDFADTPRRLAFVGQFAFGDRTFDQLSPEEQERLIGGAFDLASLPLAVGSIGLGKVLTRQIAKPFIKRFTRGAAFGAAEGLLVPAREEAGTLAGRAKSVGISTVLGGAIPGVFGREAVAPTTTKALSKAAEATTKAVDTRLANFEVEEIAEELTGALSQQVKLQADEFISFLEPRREAAKRAGKLAPEIERRISEKELIETGTEMILTARSAAGFLKKIGKEAGEKETRAQAEALLSHYLAIEQRFFKQGKVFGRTGQTLNKTKKELTAIAKELQEFGIDVGELSGITNKLPVFSEFSKKVAEDGFTIPAAGGLFIDFWRRNIFPLMSFAKDLGTNATAIASELEQDFVSDVAKALTGKGAQFTATKGFIQSLKQLLPAKLRPELTLEAVEKIGGRPIAYGESFRQFFANPRTETIVFAPLKLKSAIDQAGQRMGIISSLHTEGLERGIKKGLKGKDLDAFVDNFIREPGEEAAARAAAKGGRQGFRRELGPLSRKVSNSKFVQLFATPFPSWNFQFSKFMVEHSPFAPSFFKKFAKGKASSDDLVRFMTRAMTGANALTFMDQVIYDNVDFNRMELVIDDTHSTNLMGLTPVPDLLALNALMRGDAEKAVQAFQSSSLLFGPLLEDGGGILGKLLNSTVTQLRTGKVDPNRYTRALEQTLSTLVPGRGLLQTMERLMDDVQREGTFRDVPFISALEEPVIDPVTGKAKRQAGEGVGGFLFQVGAPGGQRLVDPLETELRKVGISLFSFRPEALLEFNRDEVPPKLARQFNEIASGYMALYGRKFIMENPAWDRLNTNDKRLFAMSILRNAQLVATAQIESKDPAAVLRRLRREIKEQGEIQEQFRPLSENP